MKNLKRLFYYLKDHKPLMVLSLLFALLSVLSKMAIPFVSGKAIDVIKGGGDISVYLIVIGACIVIGALFRYVFDVMVANLGQVAVKSMRDDAYKAINNASLSYIDSKRKGDLLLCLVNDVENVQTGLISGASALYEGIVQIAVTIVFMFVLNWGLALLVIFLSPISVIVSRFVSKKNSKYYKDQNAKTATLTGYSLETINNLESSKAYCTYEKKKEEFDKLNSSLRTSNFKATFAVGWINPSTRLVNNIIYAFLILAGAMIVIKQGDVASFLPLTVGSLASFLSYATQFMTPFNEISNVASEVSYAVASFKRIDALISEPSDIDEGKELFDGEIDTLEAENIDFSYDGSRQIIKNFNVDIYKGHKIALVGPTGCGKSTIINLLLRFYDPQRGAFIANGKEITSYPKKDLRGHIGMVLQETWLFKGTIRDNIAYGKKNATEEEIVAAAKKAHADGFIRQMEKGYDTVVSNSFGLSTGQKQLLCVARIILMEPEVVVLDEATSNIDLRTELSLASSFDELMEGKTSIVVAHRLSTIKNSDLILVMKDGEIIESGNFEELLAKKGFFKELHDSQLA
ncbi:MAG: ABC transporter ATP-binding protein/permease [Bacilli bacterium]|nr:ABC transporter ATP-binding protein/permease [Bacilli bacterium]